MCHLHKPVLSPGRMEHTSGASKVIYHGKNEAAPVRAEEEPRARHVVVDEYAQEFAREDDGRDANLSTQVFESEAERRKWDWGARGARRARHFGASRGGRSA